MRNILILSILAVVFLTTSCQTNRLTVAFYNVENLFDTLQSPNKFDGEFTPDSSKNWNTTKYQKKIADLAKVIASIDEKRLPALVGVCEIENNSVLKDLVSDPLLSKVNYRIIWEESPDLRGIDCALLYDPAFFEVEKYEMLPVKNPVDTSFTTRDIVFVQGILKGERCYVFVNHWPSRREGESVSEGKRNLAAIVVREKVDSIFNANPLANIIIMGDLNDEPSNASISETLKALPNKLIPAPTDLVNLMYDELERGEGSYSYRNEWDMIDNLIVSGNLIIKKKGLKTTIDNGYVFHRPFMEFVNDKGQMSPNRTYGRSYFGGVSDHFPVYLILK